MNYVVTWDIDIEADSPEAAAAEAHKIMLDAGSTAVIFDVADRCGKRTRVDLLADKSWSLPSLQVDT